MGRFDSTHVGRVLVDADVLQQRVAELGAMITEDYAGRRPLLVGVLIPTDKGPDVALFDCRLGLPVDNGAEGVATLAAAKNDPKLLDVDWKQAEVRLAFESAALAPRMRFLEDQLASRERITLYQDAQELYTNVATATGLKIAGWPGTPPWRLAREFFPPGEGGTDKTDRLRTFAIHLLPVTPARRAGGGIARS